MVLVMKRLNLMAQTDSVGAYDINIPGTGADGLTFGDDGEKIEGDGTDLTISGNNINLTEFDVIDQRRCCIW